MYHLIGGLLNLNFSQVLIKYFPGLTMKNPCHIGKYYQDINFNISIIFEIRQQTFLDGSGKLFS